MKNTFAHITQTPYIKYKHAKGMRDILGKEFHHFHEIFLFISGNAFFTSENRTIKLNPYTLIIIPENTFHSFYVDGDEADYERYIFNFYSTKEIAPLISRNMNCIHVIEAAPDSIISNFTSLDDDRYSDFEKELLTTAKLTSVLVELGHLLPKEEQVSVDYGKITAECLKYINKNIHSPLTVADLSKKLNYARTSITHAFKADLHISVYKYIIEKKMAHARKDIQSGLSATAVSQKYGFSDYSCFYRHYKKQFGVPPSAKSSKW